MTIKDFITGWFAHSQQYWQAQKRQSQLYGPLAVAPTDLYQLVHETYAPCFVLSTGRCGTQLLTALFEQHLQADAHHEPAPELLYFGKYAYEHQQSQFNELKVAIDAARYELIRDAYLLHKIYLETNNRITFFAPQLAQLFPKAKFLHLVRSPESFVKSGLGREWYNGTRLPDEGRITPLSGPARQEWPSWNQTQKIAWLWDATNQFIEDFKATQAPDRHLTVLAEDLFRDPEVTNGITDFFGLERFTPSIIRSTISQPVNKGKTDTSLSPAQKVEISELTPLQGFYYKKGT